MIETELTMLKIQLLVSTFLIAIISISISIQIGNNFGLRMKMASKNTRPFS